MSGRDIDRFDRWGPTYDQSWLQEHFFEPVHQATLEATMREVTQPSRVLDIGCGTGQLLQQVATHFPNAEIVGVDPAAKMIQQATTTFSSDASVRFVQASAENLPLRDARFDLILSTMSFHHWADQHRGLREIRRVLTSEGIFALTDGAVSGLVNWVFALLRPGRLHSLPELVELFRTEDLRVIDRRWVPNMSAQGNGVQVMICRANTPRTPLQTQLHNIGHLRS